MQKIVPHLWFDKEAKEAGVYFTSLLPNSSVTSVHTITGTPSGDCDIVSFELAGYALQAMSAGPYFKFTPAISLSIQCATEEEIDRLYTTLIEGGSALMPLDNYGFSKKYGWINDRYGLSWQLNLPADYASVKNKIAPFFLFVGDKCGKAEEAIRTYTSLFPDSSMGQIFRHGAGTAERAGTVQHATFNLFGQEFMAMDSAFDHKFTFNESISFMVKCDDQKEIDYYWEKLSAVPDSEQCGWLKDKYGVSWQIVPSAMDKMMATTDKAALGRVTQAFLAMKKFDIAILEKAFTG